MSQSQKKSRTFQTTLRRERLGASISLDAITGRFSSSIRTQCLVKVCIVGLFLVGVMSESFAQVPEQTEYYGEWQPPNSAVNPSAVNPSAANPSAANPSAANPSAANPSGSNSPITTDNFRSYFPPRQAVQPNLNQQTGSSLQPRDEQATRNNVPKSSFVATTPPRHVPVEARPLQPILSSNNTNVLKGAAGGGNDFQPARMAKLPPFPTSNSTKSNSSFIPATQQNNGFNPDVVRQANFESFESQSNNFALPDRDPNTASMEPGLLGESAEALESLEQTASSASGNIQSWFKNTTAGWFDGSQSSGGWGEKISGLFSGMNEPTRKMVGSLALVLGGYFAFVALMRRINPKGNRGIPAEVVEVIGNTPFGPRKNLQLVRLGSKLLLLMNTPEGTHPVGEITDPTEVEYLISLCSGKRQKASRSVLSVVDQLKSATIGQQPTMNSLVHAAVGASPVANAATSAIANSGASTTAINEVLRALEKRKTSTVFEA